ncbi:hypothetical protein BRPE64_BCDS08920 [Caballeronia insecticola]|uniref:Uncharacterized protein n=1 Tax=Caballeronia insecticola TaxID=758793 RepID=R4WLR6_9BURK|nr:hypothetical protein BRPE64_BCDS08920 [Caballeronia insecticola]
MCPEPNRTCDGPELSLISRKCCAASGIPRCAQMPQFQGFAGAIELICRYFRDARLVQCGKCAQALSRQSTALFC